MEMMGFLISHKNNEQRRALLPTDLECIRHRDHLLFETGYGESVNFTDEDYLAAGVKIGTREEVLRCGMLVDVKLGDADYLDQLQGKKLMIGWAHTVQKVDFTTAMLQGRHSVLAWEEIFEDGRYIFYRNREVAGEAAVLQAFRRCRMTPGSPLSATARPQKAPCAFCTDSARAWTSMAESLKGCSVRRCTTTM